MAGNISLVRRFLKNIILLSYSLCEILRQAVSSAFEHQLLCHEKSKKEHSDYLNVILYIGLLPKY